MWRIRRRNARPHGLRAVVGAKPSARHKPGRSRRTHARSRASGWHRASPVPVRQRRQSSASARRQGCRIKQKLWPCPTPLMAAVFTDLPLQGLDPVELRRCLARRCPLIPLGLPHPFAKGLRRTADLRGDRTNRRPTGWVVTRVVLHHSHRAFSHLKRKFVGGSACDRSILSRVGASNRPGAVQSPSAPWCRDATAMVRSGDSAHDPSVVGVVFSGDRLGTWSDASTSIRREASSGCLVQRE